MFDARDLKNLEKKAFRATHQDGLWDIYVGCIVLSMLVLAYSDASQAYPLMRFSLFLVGLGMSYLLFRAGKKYLTTPRQGQVKFGPRRQKRKATLMIVLSGMVLLQLVLLAGTFFLWRNPQYAASLGFIHSGSDLERLLVAISGAIIAGFSTAIIAYFNDFPRGFYIAFILSLTVFSLIFFGEPIYLIVTGLLIIVPGLVLFIRFMREHPLPPVGLSHE